MHTMTKVRWTVLAAGTVALALAVLLTDSVTATFIAGYAYGLGLLTLLAADRIIARTRNHPQTRLANARQGTLDR